MLIKGTGFARYSKSLCWIVAAIWLALSVLSFTSGAENATVNGILWLVGAVAFAVSGFALGRNSGSEPAQSSEAND